MTELELHVAVADLVLASGIRRPQVRLYSGGPLNAYSSWNNGPIVYVHRDMLDLPHKEVSAVLAHELGHLAGNHPLLIGVVRLLCMAVSCLVWVVLPFGLALSVVGACWIAYGAVVRWAEYSADAWAVRHGGAKVGLLQWLCRRNRQPWYSWHPEPRARIDRIVVPQSIVLRTAEHGTARLH